MTQICPCSPSKAYSECCMPFHLGKENPPSPLLLMKSRYSAYALQLFDYIVETTHPQNPRYLENKVEWINHLKDLSDKTTFNKLEILEHTPGEKEGYVTFIAYFAFEGKDTFFKERSHFLKEDGKWYYHDIVSFKSGSEPALKSNDENLKN